MFCYVVANNLNCVLSELAMWTDISSEHPIFIKTVAKLTKKDLPKEIVEELNEISKKFREIHQKTNRVAGQISGMHMMYPVTYEHIRGTKELMSEFVSTNREWLKILEEVKKYGKNDEVWQTLLEHIEHEQIYMDRLVRTLYHQM